MIEKNTQFLRGVLFTENSSNKHQHIQEFIIRCKPCTKRQERSIIVTVLNSGLDTLFSDQVNPWIFKDFVQNKTKLGDYHGHGTHVTGIISSVLPEGSFHLSAFKTLGSRLMVGRVYNIGLNVNM